VIVPTSRFGTDHVRLRNAVVVLSKLVSRDDIFISYSRADGGAYAAGLADKLTEKKFSCFIDKLGTDPDHDLPDSLKKKITNCMMLVLVGTECARRASSNRSLPNSSGPNGR
jgi:hypothetical protein